MPKAVTPAYSNHTYILHGSTASFFVSLTSTYIVVPCIDVRRCASRVVVVFVGYDSKTAFQTPTSAGNVYWFVGGSSVVGRRSSVVGRRSSVVGRRRRRRRRCCLFAAAGVLVLCWCCIGVVLACRFRHRLHLRCCCRRSRNAYVTSFAAALWSGCYSSTSPPLLLLSSVTGTIELQDCPHSHVLYPLHHWTAAWCTGNISGYHNYMTLGNLCYLQALSRPQGLR